MFDAYIWDFDGTLFDSYPIMLAGFMNTLEDYGVAADEKEVYKILKALSSKSVAEKYQLDFAAFTETFKSYEKKDQRIPESFPGTKEILEAVVAKGAKNYILTHREVGSTHELLKKEGMDHLVVEVVGPENNFPRKPDPASLNYLVEKYQLIPEKTVMIGDRTMDILAGQGAGVKTIFYDIDYLLEEMPADYTVHSMAEFAPLI